MSGAKTIAVTLFILIAVGPALLASEKAAEPDVKWLFVQSGSSGAFDGERVTLGNVPPTVMFTDRPVRLSGHIQTADYLADTWGDEGTFRKDPPNAVLSVFGEGKVTVATVVLTDPKLDGKNLSYAVRILEGKIPETFGQASLFVDCWHHPHPHIGAFVVGAAVGHAITRSNEPKTVVVEDTHHYYTSDPAPTTVPKSAEDKLTSLKSMLDRGLIDQADYDRKKAEILKGM